MQQIKISIPEPCHEGWENMSPTEKGRFCGSCQKEVIDFTGMTDAELFAFFTNKNVGSVCGRTHITQLDTPITKPPVYKKKRFWYLQYAATFLLLLTRPGGAKAQLKPSIIATLPSAKPVNITLGQMVATPPVTPTERWIQGKIQDESDEPIPFASIAVKGARRGVAADDKGNFLIQAKKGDVLQISAILFEVKEVVVQDKMPTSITLIRRNTMMEGAIVVVGAVSNNNDDAVAYDMPKYKSLLAITDKNDGSPIANAAIDIKKIKSNGKHQTIQTHASKTGQYWLRKIKEGDAHAITITAAGYQPYTLVINGSQLSKGNNLQAIRLEKMVMNEQPAQPFIEGKIVPNEPFCLIPQELAPSPVVPLTGFDAALQGKVGGMVINKIDAPAETWHSIRGSINNLLQLVSKSFFIPTKTVPNIKVYPNPVVGNNPITIAFGKVPKGSYTLRLTSITGAQLQQQTITVPAEQFNFEWQLGSKATAGNYIITVLNSSNQSIYNSKITVL